MFSMKRKKSITSEQEPLQKETFSKKVVNVLLAHFNYTFDIELSDKTKNLILSNCSTFIKHYIADFFICNFIISLAVVSFWRGVWDHSILYFEEFLKQENSSLVTFLHSKSVVKDKTLTKEEICLVTNAICLMVGIIVTQLISWGQFRIKHLVQMDESVSINKNKYKPIPSTWFMLVSRIFAVIWGFSDIYLWKGLWDGIDCYFAGGEKDWTVAATTFAIGVIILTFAGALRSALSAPVGIVVDDYENCLKCCTYLETKEDDESHRRFFDQFLTLFLEMCVVLTWHGVWSLEDLMQKKYFEHTMKETAWISFGFGVLTCLIVYILQFAITIYSKQDDKKKMEEIYTQENSLPLCAKNYNNWNAEPSQYSANISQKILFKIPSRRSIGFRMVNFIFTLIGIISTINMFRGYWFLLDEYFMNDHYDLSLIHGQIYGALVLTACFASCSLHAGVFKDEYMGEKCLIEFYYTSYFYIKRLEDMEKSEIARNHISFIPPTIIISECPDTAFEINAKS